MSGSNKALDFLRRLPRVTLNNLGSNPGAFKISKRRIKGKTHGCGRKNNSNFMPIGYETGNIPFHLRFKSGTFYDNYHQKLAYVPLSMARLQRAIETDRVRSDVPVDVTQLMLSGLYGMGHQVNEGGFLVEEDGIDCFDSKINLEIQWTNEAVIATVERNGGTITSAYYDPVSLYIAAYPEKFFMKGEAIPRRMIPPQNLIEYYTNPKNRGYLADPELIAEERLKLAQKYGYTLPNIAEDPKKDILLARKDPRQIFYGLEPGWVVNLPDKKILKPTDPDLKEFYAS